MVPMGTSFLYKNFSYFKIISRLSDYNHGCKSKCVRKNAYFLFSMNFGN